MHGILPKVVKLTILYKQQLRYNTILSRALFRNAQQCNALLYGAGVAESTVMLQHRIARSVLSLTSKSRSCCVSKLSLRGAVDAYNGGQEAQKGVGKSMLIVGGRFVTFRF
jgi:hypothetical protein